MTERPKTCDLHTHSNYSDGSLSPAELVALCENAGLSAVALTDHNTAKGLSEFMAAGEKSTVETVAGCEFSTEFEGGEVHIAGLFLPPDTWDEVERYTMQLLIAKKRSNEALIAALNKNGYDVTYDEAAALTDADEFNRAHVARVLFDKGYVNSTKEAFDTLLKEEHGFYVPPKRPDALETVKFIKSCRAVAVLCHPFLNLSRERLPRFLSAAKSAGLDAMETRYSDFDETASREASNIAREYGLKESGGSDFHGAAKPDISPGTGRGPLCVPLEFYEALKG
ncbi:MAG: PHP domain-containing protein [Clostridia bacterium]|nr:PHP domain-containing protein [Clostridia bacterium]